MRPATEGVRSGRIGLLGALLALAGLLAPDALAVQLPKRADADIQLVPTEPVVTDTGCDAPGPALIPLLLRAVVNASNTERDLVLFQRPCGAVLIAMTDLRALRVRDLGQPSVEIDGQRYVNLNAYPGLTYRLLSVQQVIAIEGEPWVFDPSVIDLRPVRNALPARADLSAFLNYGLSLNGEFDGEDPAVSGFGNIGISAWPGVLTTDGGFTRQSGQTQLYRSRTQFRRDFPEWIATLRAGDVATRPGAWGSSLALGGVQFGTNFSTRPSLQLTPVTMMDAAISRVSTMRVLRFDERLDPIDLAEQARQERGRQIASADRVPYGPVEILNLPVYRNGEYELRLRDARGAETIVRQPFFFGTGLLRPGLSDYSVSLGVPRVGFFTDRYDGFAASGLWRIGVTHYMTGELHVEGEDDTTIAAGVSTEWAVPAVGRVRATWAQSHDDLVGSDQFAALSLENRYLWGGYATRLDCTGERFRTVTQRDSGIGSTVTNAACRIFASGALRLPRSQSINLAFTQNNRRDGIDTRAYSLGLFGRVPWLGGSYSLSGSYQDVEGGSVNDGWSIGFGLTARLGAIRRSLRRPSSDRRFLSDDRTRFAIRGSQSRDGDFRLTGTATTVERFAPSSEPSNYFQSRFLRGRTPESLNDEEFAVLERARTLDRVRTRRRQGYTVGLSASSDLIDFENQGLSANINTRNVTTRATLTRSGDDYGYSLGMNSAFAWIGNEFHITRPLLGSYALVKLGEDYPGARVNGQWTDRNGSVLLPTLQPYQENILRLNTDDMPFNVRAEVDEIPVVPRFRSGVVVRPQLRTVVDALVRVQIRHANGNIIDLPLGAYAQLIGGAVLPEDRELLPVGYGGEIYVPNVLPNSQLAVFHDGRRCVLTLQPPERPESDAFAELGPYLCDTL